MKGEEMHRKIKYTIIFLVITIVLLSGCSDKTVSANTETIKEPDLYNLIAEYIPEIKDMQCTLDEEFTYKNDIGYPTFYIKFLEKSIQNIQRNKIYGGEFSCFLDSIAKYNPESVYNIEEISDGYYSISYQENRYDNIADPHRHIWEGKYYVLEFNKVTINDYCKQTIKYTIFIKEDYENDTKPRINLWKHTETKGFGYSDVYMPNYDTWNLEYTEIDLKK